jgi:hypothetical protein
LRKKLMRLDQGDKSVQDYYGELQKGLQRCKIVEGAEDVICHFCSDLRRDIQDILDYKDFDTVNKLFQFAMLAEKEVHGWQQSQHQPRSTFGATPMPKTMPRTPPTPPAPTRSSSSAPATGKPIL